MLLIPTLVVLAAGCPRKPAGPATGDRAVERTDGPGKPEPRECEDILFDLDQAILGGSNECDRDEDCACFDQSWKEGTCGAVTRRDGIPELEKLAREAGDAGCPLPRPCPTFTCKPHCRPRPHHKGFCTQLTRCVELSEQFESVLAQATNACKTAKDCGTYRAGVGHNCGGVTDGQTAGKLAKIAAAFFEEDCPYTVHCAPRGPFHIECRSGACIRVSDDFGPPPG